MFLRSYRRIARDEHWCDCCCTYIQPGEEYEGRVEVYKRGGKNRIRVWKEHVNPCCEPPEDPDYDYDHDEVEEYVELKKAA